MPTPGIKTVWAGWNDDEVIGFSDRAYSRWKNRLPLRTRMLIYETDISRPDFSDGGTKCIVGEVEVVGSFADGVKFPSPTEEHPHLLPVKTIVSRAIARPVPLALIRDVVKDKRWPLQGEA